MKCLNSVAPLVKYLIKGAFCKDIQPRNKQGGTFAREVETALELINCGNSSFVSLYDLKTVGKPHNQVKGFQAARFR